MLLVTHSCLTDGVRLKALCFTTTNKIHFGQKATFASKLRPEQSYFFFHDLEEVIPL